LSSDRERLWLRDIIDYRDDVRRFLEGMSFEQICSDRKTVATIERYLQCITEAAIRIGDVRMTVIAPTSRCMRSADWEISSVTPMMRSTLGRSTTRPSTTSLHYAPPASRRWSSNGQ
jgi:hypothetical protein